MVKKSILYTLGFIFLFFAEAIIHPITLFGVSPMYVLCGVAAVGILEKERFGAIFGLIFGLFCDFASGSLFGVNALCFMITGIVAGLLAETTLAKNFISALIVSESSVIVFNCIQAVIYTALNDTKITEVATYILLPKILLTLPFTIIIFFMMKLINYLSSRDRERTRRRSW